MSREVNMKGTNPTEFERWCADEMGHTVEYMVMQRNKNMLGCTVYKHEEIDKRYRAWSAGTSFIRKNLIFRKPMPEVDNHD